MKLKKWKELKTWNCHDCGVEEGKFHKEGCDNERCIDCGGQLISCKCKNKKFGRIPYLIIPTLCGLCGEQWPIMFMVPEEEWNKYVLPELQNKILCLKCYKRLKKLFSGGWDKKILYAENSI